MAQTNRSVPSASTAPGTPEWDRDTPRWWPDRIAWTRKNEANETSSPTMSVTVPAAAALAASTARRRGTAAKVVRISPVACSELNARAPSTPTASTAYSKLMKLGMSGSIGGRPAGGWVAKATATMALSPMVVTTAMSSVQYVERTERSLVNSEVSTSRARMASDGT